MIVAIEKPYIKLSKSKFNFLIMSFSLRRKTAPAERKGRLWFNLLVLNVMLYYSEDTGVFSAG